MSLLETNPLGPRTEGVLMSEVRMDRTLAHQLKMAIGIGLCAYEAAGLAVGNREALPCITDLSHPDEQYPDQDMTRLAIALACTLWVCAHLMRPWVVRLVRWLRARIT